MNLSAQAQEIYTQIGGQDTKLGDLRKIAKTIKKNHDLALELWSTGNFYARQLAILIMDKKLISQELIDKLDKDIQNHEYSEKTQLADWLMSNQLTKDKKTIALIETWAHSPSPIQRRIFWYYQARLRWMGKTDHDNTDDLLVRVENEMANEAPEVQWAMNFTTGWIGTFDDTYRNRCIDLGEKIGLFKDEVVSKGCTPNYLPQFISIEVDKRKNK